MKVNPKSLLKLFVAAPALVAGQPTVEHRTANHTLELFNASNFSYDPSSFVGTLASNTTGPTPAKKDDSSLPDWEKYLILFSSFCVGSCLFYSCRSAYRRRSLHDEVQSLLSPEAQARQHAQLVGSMLSVAAERPVQVQIHT